MPLLQAANFYEKSSVNRDTGRLQIRTEKYRELLDSLSLYSHSVKKERYPNGTLQKIQFEHRGTIFSIDFYQGKPKEPETIRSVRSYRLFERKLLLHGTSEFFSPKGVLLEEKNWYKGQLDGRQRLYFPNRQLFIERYYYEGFPIQTWRQYTEEGIKIREISFPKDKKEWKETRNEGYQKSLSGEKNLKEIPYLRPFSVREIWYDQRGKKVEERILLAYWEKGRFMLSAPSSKEKENFLFLSEKKP